MNVKLTPRLSAVASLVKGGGIVADIGTDHAYLPVYLLQNGVVKGAVAADIGEMPLKNAAKSLESYGLADTVELRLSDGLAEFSPGDADEYIFAGMGGTLIARILSQTEWVKDANLHFIFQPQSRAEDLRKYLFENGFEIGGELAVREGRRVYICFDAVFTGEPKSYSAADCFIGGLSHTQEACEYLSHQLVRLREKYAGYENKGECDERKTLFEIIGAIEKFMQQNQERSI